MSWTPDTRQGTVRSGVRYRRPSEVAGLGEAGYPVALEVDSESEESALRRHATGCRTGRADQKICRTAKIDGEKNKGICSKGAEFKMKNQYMFFKPQSFENADLTQYQKTDIPIKQTQVCIYEFECAESNLCYDDEMQAKMLDDLTLQLSEKYPDAFRVIYAESSQFFCQTLYPLIVELETKLRQVLYISRTLYENEEIKADMFQYPVGKEKKTIEELDFGQIYTAIFTDAKFKSALMQKYDNPLTKVDLLKIIQELEELTEWHKIMGSDYDYIEHHFLEIKDFRNDVMHNHLINYAT